MSSNSNNNFKQSFSFQECFLKNTKLFILAFISSTALLYVTYYCMDGSILNIPAGAYYFIISSADPIRRKYNTYEIPVKNGYVVWSPNCKIPNISPSDKSVKMYIKKIKLIKCTNGYKGVYRPLTMIKHNKITKNHLVEIQLDNLSGYVSKKNFDNLHCCYSVIYRQKIPHIISKSDDNRFKMEKSVCFKNKTDLPKNTEFIFINCTMRNMKNKKTKKIYENTHAMVIPKNNSNKNPELKFEKNEFLKNLAGNQTVDADLFSVLIFGIDSISNLNLRRTMPKTVRYLNDTGWLYLDGYTKVAENTFPNLIPILTGLNVDELTKKCWNVSDAPLDNCPFIWKEYKLKSYLTAYVEDEPTIGTFNFHKYGFLNAPTDYYTRPYMLASEKLLKVKTINSLSYCLGEKSSAERILEYCQDFIRTLEKNPFFGLFWTNTFSHNELNEPSSMDERMRKFFQDILKLLNNHTLVIFLSDHGMRWGGIRTTFTGWLEERMPFIYFWIPEEFKKKFPEKYSNLLKNKNKLTSPFDLYLTLSDILNNNEFVNPAIAENCPKCKSLFSEIPWNRNCKDAAIPYEWCTCASDFVHISIDDSVVKLIVNYVLKKINQRLTVVNKSGYKIQKGTKCAYLNLHKITSAEKQLADSSNHINDTYLIILEANPSRAVFEATVTVKSDMKNFSVLSDSVSRISTYGSQSYCAEEYGIKMYCYCIRKS